MSRQAGLTLGEFLVAAALSAAIALVTFTFSVDWMRREELRSGIRALQSAVQLNRMEAVNRNRPCRLVVDTANSELQVWDGNGTSTTGDDELLHTSVLPSSVRFARPDSGSAVTLASIGEGKYQVVFGSDGTVSSGDGEVVLFGGDRYDRLTVFAAGGVRIDSWNGTEWDD